ncbi:MAG: anti-sigma factor [Ideonella sp.]|nr:anti-sigma factor [Ideonella sp.]MCC7456722.1 anti-sigma factor [Nitrospira sp.]
MDYARPERADALAAQYVAGTLRGRARRRFEALLGAHANLRVAVRRWQDRLMPLTTVLPPQAPPPRVWRGIERALWPAASAAPPAAWWQRVAFWRLASGAASTAALALALLVATPGPQAPPIVVVLQGTGDAAQPGGSFVASFSGDGRSLVTRPLQPVALQSDRVLELWAVPPQGAPRSLGLISASGVSVIARDKLPQQVLDRSRTAALAVSVEPPGGSPTGAPTGPVVFAGKLTL